MQKTRRIQAMYAKSIATGLIPFLRRGENPAFLNPRKSRPTSSPLSKDATPGSVGTFAGIVVKNGPTLTPIL